MSDLLGYFLNSKTSVIQYELIEISHSSFSQVFYFVRNAINGLVVTLENSVEQEFIYLPMTVKRNGNRNNLDYGIDISLGDLDELVLDELELVFQADTFSEKPNLKYRTYRSDDLSSPMDGPIKLEIDSFAFTGDGNFFSAKPPATKVNATGQIYSFDRFETLRGLI